MMMDGASTPGDGVNRLDLGSPLINPARVTGTGNRVFVGANCRIDAHIVIEGHGNTVTIADNCTIIGHNARIGATITIHGDGNTVTIAEGCTLDGYFGVIGVADASLRIGAGTTMVQATVQLHEPGEIVFGRDCMISSQVYVSLSDMHPIYDRRTAERINPPASVVFGDHVWAGFRSMIMKGTKVGDGAVIAAGAVVSGPVPANAVMAGVPARLVREDVVWRRTLAEGPPEPMPHLTSARTASKPEVKPRKWTWWSAGS
jgi:acetyltransferase-like isoleucine patch superfamily enzyme